VIINKPDEAERAIKELAGKIVRSQSVTIKLLGKSKSTETERRPEIEMEKKPETALEAAVAAESIPHEFGPDMLRNDTADPPSTDRRRLGSPPPLARKDPAESQNLSSVDASVPISEQQDRLTSSIQTRKRKLEEMEQFQEEMEAFRKRQRDEMEDFHKRQRDEMEEFQKRQREELEEKMENWKAETADLERTAKRRKIVLNRSAEPDSSQDPVGSREIEGGAADADAGAGETGAPDSTNTTYGPHELNLRAISERLGRIDDLKLRQADGETLARSDLLEIKMEEQVRLELNREIKSSPGLEPRAMDDVDQDLRLLDAPGADQTDGTRDADASSSITPVTDAGHDQDETPAARTDVKMEMEDREFNGTANANSNGKGTSRAEKAKVYIKLEDDDD